MPEFARVRRSPLDRIAEADWARLARGSFFASRGFLELWRAKRGRPVAWTLEDAGRLVAAVPGVEYGSGPFARFASLPDGCYGGVRVDEAAAPERARFAAELMGAIAARGYAKSCVFDFDGAAGPRAGFVAEREQTRLADISAPDWAPPDAKLRSQIRKAEREGIAVERFDWDRHHRGFLALVEGSARHHGQRPRYPASLYRSLARLAETDDRIQWRYCEHDGRPAASHIYFVERDALLAWQSHFDRAFSFLKPNQYVRFTLCREMAARGVHWLNLGSSPAHASGLAYYKARWGGAPVRYVNWTRWEGLGALARALVGARGVARAARVAANGSLPRA